MWNNFVSHADAMLSTVIARCVETVWRYPAVGMAFLTALFALTVLMWIEVWRDAVRAGHEQALEEAGPKRQSTIG